MKIQIKVRRMRRWRGDHILSGWIMYYLPLLRCMWHFENRRMASQGTWESLGNHSNYLPLSENLSGPPLISVAVESTTLPRSILSLSPRISTLSDLHLCLRLATLQVHYFILMLISCSFSLCATHCIAGKGNPIPRVDCEVFFANSISSPLQPAAW